MRSQKVYLTGQPGISPSVFKGCESRRSSWIIFQKSSQTILLLSIERGMGTILHSHKTTSILLKATRGFLFGGKSAMIQTRRMSPSKEKSVTAVDTSMPSMVGGSWFAIATAVMTMKEITLTMLVLRRWRICSDWADSVCHTRYNKVAFFQNFCLSLFLVSLFL